MVAREHDMNWKHGTPREIVYTSVVIIMQWSNPHLLRVTYASLQIPTYYASEPVLDSCPFLIYDIIWWQPFKVVVVSTVLRPVFKG